MVVDEQPTCFSCHEMDWVLRFPSSVYDGIQLPSNGITVALHGALGAQPPVSSTKHPARGFWPSLQPRSPQRTTVVDTAALATHFPCPRDTSINSPTITCPLRPRAPATPTIALYPSLAATACQDGRAFRAVEMLGSPHNSFSTSIGGESVFPLTEALSFTFSS